MLDNFHMLTSVICLQKSLFPAQGACPTFVDFAVDISRRSELSKLWLSTLKLAMQICPIFCCNLLAVCGVNVQHDHFTFFSKRSPPPLWVSYDTWQSWVCISANYRQFQVPQVCLEAILAWRSSPACWACGCDLWACGCDLWACGCDLWACGCDLVLLLFGGWFSSLKQKG